MQVQERKNIILTDKKYQQLFRAVEMNIDEEHLHKLLPNNYDFDSLNTKRVEYFKKYGFKVPAFYSDIYKMYNGIESDRYIPASLYYYYITPFLCNLNLMEAYVDKNMYSTFFPDVKQPETIVKRINGRCYDSEMKEMSFHDAICELERNGKFIIKPSLETGEGRGVQLVNATNREEIERILIADYFDNWIAQRVLKCNKEMAQFNETSVNTMRIYTYRPVGTSKYVVLGSILRFGGQGAAIDNACTGGRFVSIDKNGITSEKVLKYRDFSHQTCRDFGFEYGKLSMYDKACELSLSLHARLPYFDLVGWDITVDDNNDLVFLEFNRTPACEFIQVAHGPMFGEYLDDLMEAIKDHKTEYTVVADRSFARGKQCSSHYFDFKKL